MNELKVKNDEGRDIIVAFHGSPITGIDILFPHVAAGSGANGAMFGTGVYLAGNDSIPLVKRYAGTEGSVYASELDISDYITVSEDTYLTNEQGRVIADIVNELDPELKIRMSTDIGGRVFHEFVDLDEAENFYDDQEALLESIGRENDFSPISRCEVRVESNTPDGKFVVSTARFELPDDWSESVDKPASTSDISRSLNLVSNSLATSFWRNLGSGLVIYSDDKDRAPEYLSFSSVEPKREFDASMGIEDIRNWCIGNIVNKPSTPELQVIKTSKEVDKFSSLFYVDAKGYVSENEFDLKLGDVVAEVYIEPRPRKKFYIDKISGSHELVAPILKTFKHSFAFLDEYNVIFDNNPPVTVNELLSEIEQKESVLVEDNDKTIVLYHGTSSEFLNSIGSAGLQGRDVSLVDSHYYNSNTAEALPDRVYLGDEYSMGIIRSAARSAVRSVGGSPIILKVELPVSVLNARGAADEDSAKTNWRDSLDTLGTLAVIGGVEPRFIEVAEMEMHNRFKATTELEHSIAQIAFADAKALSGALDTREELPSNTVKDEAANTFKSESIRSGLKFS